MLHDQRAGDVAARRLVVGGGGDAGVGGVGSLVLALAAQGEGVVAGVVRARVGGRPGRTAVCLHLGRVCVARKRDSVCVLVCV